MLRCVVLASLFVSLHWSLIRIFSLYRFFSLLYLYVKYFRCFLIVCCCFVYFPCFSECCACFEKYCAFLSVLSRASMLLFCVFPMFFPVLCSFRCFPVVSICFRCFYVEWCLPYPCLSLPFHIVSQVPWARPGVKAENSLGGGINEKILRWGGGG